MARSARLIAVAASLAAMSPPMPTALAFAPGASSSLVSSRRRRIPTVLSYRAGAEAPVDQEATTTKTIRVADAPHVDDATHASLLHNPLNLPVLVDCYVSKCGPCKLIERSLDAVLPKYSDQLLFCKWDADKKEESERFVELLRAHDTTFRKLPTLILFAEGRPVAMRSGMATAGQLEKFLEEHLPRNELDEEECVDEVNLAGEKFLCEE